MEHRALPFSLSPLTETTNYPQLVSTPGLRERERRLTMIHTALKGQEPLAHDGPNREERSTDRRTSESPDHRSCLYERYSDHDCSPIQGGVPLKGWEFMQERILSHDEDMIGDFSDDIDTLLVFVSADSL